MNFTYSTFLGGMIFGTFGIYFIKRGRNEAHLLRIALGVTLMVFPWFISSQILLWSIGAVLMTIAFKAR